MLSLLHTPDGVRDYHGKELSERAQICGRLRKVFESRGYTEVVTPVFEYFDIFNAERGSVSSRNMFKFYDNDGETLVLRPDFTPAMARCAAKYFNDSPVPVRLSYMGNRYVNSSGHRGKIREEMQAGAELSGDGSCFSDAEMLDMTAALFVKAGVENFIIDVGDIRFFRGLLAEAGLDAEQEAKITRLLSKKNFYRLGEVLTDFDVRAEIAEALTELAELYGDPEEVFEKAVQYDFNEDTHAALARLKDILRAADCYGIRDRLKLDMGMISRMDYYTGMIFKAYAEGAGEPVVSGGRYDGLLSQFGRSAPAVGFGLSVDVLMQAVAAAGNYVMSGDSAAMIVFDDERSDEAIILAKELRNAGRNVLLQRSVSIDYAKQDESALRNVTEIYVLHAGTDEIVHEKV